jgi:hypothetical protein
MPHPDPRDLLIPSDALAQRALHHLTRVQEAFVKDMPSNHQLVVYALINGEEIRVSFGQWINPTTVLFIQDPQTPGETRKVFLQHVSQMNVCVTSEEINKPTPEQLAEPKRIIGFGPG